MSKWFVLLAVVCLGCATRSPPLDGLGPSVSPPTAPPRLEGLGERRRPISQANAEGQKWFDQGLNLVYGFNHDESVKAFRHATAVSPECAMCFWGLAYALGPHINNPAVPPEVEKAASQAVKQSVALAAGASEVERALIEALSTRYADPQPKDRAPLDQAYAEAMRAVYAKHPHDADVAALTAEALMDLHPWDTYAADGTPKPWMPEILQLTEVALKLEPRHPLANHLYIHAVEASSDPSRGLGAADVLRELQPGLGHMVHMPSHIDVRTGNWEQAIDANRKAIAADEAYRAQVPRQGFYSIYMVHNHQMLAYAAMMSGRSAEALQGMSTITSGIPPEFRKEAVALLDGYYAMPLEVLVRFGKWDDLLATPEFDPDLPASRALRHAARGVAYAAKGDVAHALEEQAAFRAARARVPDGWVMGQNPMPAIFEVAEHLLAGEILYRQARDAASADQAFVELRKAVAAEDALRYDEPPDWILPTRHALGASLLRSRRFAEAEQVFREDLKKVPGNGWALLGLSQSLRFQGKKPEAAEVEQRFRAVWARADIEVHSACLCQPGP